MGYILRYGNKYTTNEEESNRAGQTLSDMINIILDYLNSMEFAFRDADGKLPEDWTDSLHWNCIEESEGLGSKLKLCPFCKRPMRFYRHMHRTTAGKDVIQQYFMHDDRIEKPCVLEDIANGFVIGAGDARVEDGYLGEYGERWNASLEEGEA